MYMYVTHSCTSSLVLPVLPIVFMSPLQDVTLNNLGLKAVFECDVSKAGLKAEWLKADKTIRRGDDKYDMQVSAGNHQLVVNDAQFDDVAEYTIKFDGAQSSAKLRINGKKVHMH